MTSQLCIPETNEDNREIFSIYNGDLKVDFQSQNSLQFLVSVHFLIFFHQQPRNADVSSLFNSPIDYFFSCQVSYYWICVQYKTFYSLCIDGKICRDMTSRRQIFLVGVRFVWLRATLKIRNENA